MWAGVQRAIIPAASLHHGVFFLLDATPSWHLAEETVKLIEQEKEGSQGKVGGEERGGRPDRNRLNVPSWWAPSPKAIMLSNVVSVAYLFA